MMQGTNPMESGARPETGLWSNEAGRSGRMMGRMLVSAAAALLAGLLLRLWWIFHLGQTTNDTRLYGEFARNLLQFHAYGFSNSVHGVPAAPTPTLIRLPGYPLFLAVCFRLFGMENYTAVMLGQAAIDLWTCLLLAGLAARMFGRRAGLTALWLAALCPFTANYVAVPLTETLTLFSMALVFYAFARWRETGAGINRWLLAIGFGLGYGILLRPEQGLIAAAIVPAMLWIGLATNTRHPDPERSEGNGPLYFALRSAIVVSFLTLLPLAPWTARNWRVFHVLQPLAPRYATDPGDLINFGFQRWYRTFGVEFASTDNVYWNYDGAPIAVADLPNRAFDSNAQYAATAALLADYNQTQNPTPALDARFNAIALDRIHADPVRYYLALPVARVLDMMFRPRVEMLPVPLEWWRFDQGERRADSFALAYAALNLLFFVFAAVTVARRSLWENDRPLLLAMLATIVLRTALLLTLDNSEDRYTLEFFPVLIVLAAATLARVGIRV